MKLKQILVMVLVTLALAGCATSVPQAENFPLSKQKKAMAAQHWGMIAADAVERTRQTLAAKDFARDKPMYVAEKPEATDFDRAFRNYMITGLVNAGMPVSTKKDGAVEITYETQVVRHPEPFDPLVAGYKPGMAAATVSGLWILRNAVTRWSSASAAAGTIAMAGGYDAWRATNPGETGAEVLLTTSIVHEDRYVMRITDAYYIEEGEAMLFEACKGRSRRYCR